MKLSIDFKFMSKRRIVMSEMTYPNQRTVHIHREKVTSNFLGIKNENWQSASRDLGAHAL